MSRINLCIWQVSQLDRGRPEGVDGDEEPRSGGVVTAERAPEDDAGTSGEALADGETLAPGEALLETAEPDESTETAEPDESTASADEPEPDQGGEVAVGAEADAEAVAPLDASPADVSPADVPPSDVSPDDAPAEAQPRDAVADPPAAARTPRRTHVRRGLVAAGVALVVAMSVSAFAMRTPATVSADQTFVDAARTQGHVIAPGDQQTLIISAARKVCDRRESHGTAAERKATALSSAELVAIDQAFDTDVRGFTTLALNTYCAS
jgi:hypothetical protein